MTCLHRYWLKEFVKFFGVIQALILVLFVVIDYLSRMDKFLESSISLVHAFWYVVLKLPFMFVQLTPAAILLATITVFGVMNRNNELTAVKSSGISVYFLVKPAFFVSILLAGLMFFLGESLVPLSMSKANHIRQYDIRKQNQVSQNRNDIWIKSGNTLVNIRFFDPVHQTVSGVSATTMDDEFTLASRIDARHGRYELDLWLLEDVVEQTYNPDTADYDVTLSDMKLVDLGLVPQDLGQLVKKSDEMGFFELKAYVDKVRNEGYDATFYQVDMHGKIAFPFICVIMALTGAAAGMRSFTKVNLPAAIGLGVVIAFFYWVMYGICLSLGYAGVLPAMVAPWVANLFFLCAGFIFLIYTE
ncbi:MAG: LPS export ABC transporter permease LptG [Desulfotignum sp.]|nr:LPS export ABC transporter permease LptG [Desulfotignum sp.]MCF8124697.1 LPS export ABC transporter permease LptG [Desulfotignum sp.]